MAEFNWVAPGFDDEHWPDAAEVAGIRWPPLQWADDPRPDPTAGLHCPEHPEGNWWVRWRDGFVEVHCNCGWSDWVAPKTEGMEP